MFDAADSDDNLVLDRYETLDMLANAGVDLSRYPSWLRIWLFRRADEDRSNALEYDEYLDTLYRFAPDRLGY